MDKYPVYRKFRNGREFMKLNSNGLLVTVRIPPMASFNTFAIVHTDNKVMVEDFWREDLSTESDRDEFEKVYGEAQFQLSKALCEQ